jgi:S-adenosylmethionine decarboxylase proenzyme
MVTPEQSLRYDRATLSIAKFGRFEGLGLHVLADFEGCDSLPTKAAELREQLESAAIAMGCTLVQSVFHQFSPHGLSGVVIIAESHLAIHTWPEHQTACVDFFTCSDRMDARLGIEILFQQFNARSVTIKQIARGTE